MTYKKKLAIAGAALVSWLTIPGAAWAQTAPCANRDPYTGVCGRDVGRESIGQDPRVVGSEASSQVGESESENSDTLPVTGGDLLGLTAIGLGAVGAGAVLVRRGRRAT